MTRRRKIVMTTVAAGIAALVAAAGLVSAAVRYAAWRGCARDVAGARGALSPLADGRLRSDLKAHVAYLEARLAKGWLYAKRDVFLGRLRAETRALLAAARGERPEPHLAPGHHVIATRSRVDGAQLPTSVTVPEGWDGREPLPMVLHLHSGGVDTVMECFPAPALAGAISVMPLARGSHDYLGVQMNAVEECVDDARARYPVSGLYVMGASQGGMGAWLYAERHALEVEGVSPWCGNADPAAWQGVWESPRPEPRSPAGRAWELVRASRSPVARVGQLVTEPRFPVYVAHGTADTKIPIGHSESMARELSALGPDLRFDVMQGLGHRLPKMYEERFAWLTDRRPPGSRGPARKASVVIPPLAFVSDLAGVPPASASDPLERVAGEIDMETVRETAGTPEPAREGPTKRKYPGPACAAFEHAFAVALPEPAPAHLEACADELSETWRARYGGEARRCSDAEGFGFFGSRAEGDAHPRTLVALGSPEENALCREALAGLDVNVAPGRVRVFGREFQGEDVALVMLRPREADRRSAALVVWGSTPASYRQVWRRFAHAVDWEGDRGRWWFDYAVFDRATSGPDTFLAVGYFDHDWRFDPTLLFGGSAAERAETPGTHWPSGEAKVEGGRMWLSAVAPAEVAGLRGPAAFDRSAAPDGRALAIHGKPYARGIGMVPPATARWRLGGRFSTLKAEVGLERVDTASEIRRSAEGVRFEVWGRRPGEAALRLLAASRELGSADAPEPVEADVSGLDELELRAVPASTQVWHVGPVAWGGAALTPAR